jgi:hypothetical protein
MVVIVIPHDPDDREFDHDHRDHAEPEAREEIPIHSFGLKNLVIFSFSVFFGGWNPNGRSRFNPARRVATIYKTMKLMMVKNWRMIVFIDQSSSSASIAWYSS